MLFMVDHEEPPFIEDSQRMIAPVPAVAVTVPELAPLHTVALLLIVPATVAGHTKNDLALL